MSIHYHPETLDMIYKMVHKEHKTIVEIAAELSVKIDRIEKLYKDAVDSLKYCSTKPVNTLVVKYKVA